MSKRRPQKDLSGTPYSTRSRSAERPSDRAESNPITVSDLIDDIMADSNENPTPKSDHTSPLTIGLMKELINKLESNINARINSKIDEVKEEVGQVKNHLNRFDDNFDEIHQRISNVEDKVEDIDEVKTELKSFRTDWDEAISQINLDASRARKNNIIFQGIPGGNNDSDQAHEVFMKLCTDTLKMSQKWIDELSLNEC